MNRKPLGARNYGSIPHLPGSRMGPADHHCHEGQARICLEKKRDKNDHIYVQEKLDGSNVGVARIDGEIYPLGRAGYLASTSPYEQHHLFSDWAYANKDRFMAVLEDGERLVGEWLAQAHGTRYEIRYEPFVAFDIMTGKVRMPYLEFDARIEKGEFIPPALLMKGPCSIEAAMERIGMAGFHGAKEEPEGAVWRVERDHPTGVKGEKVRRVDFLAKYVRPNKVDGKYLPNVSGEPEVWNWRPEKEVSMGS